RVVLIHVVTRVPVIDRPLLLEGRLHRCLRIGPTVRATILGVVVETMSLAAFDVAVHDHHFENFTCGALGRQATNLLTSVFTFFAAAPYAFSKSSTGCSCTVSRNMRLKSPWVRRAFSAEVSTPLRRTGVSF